MEFEFLKPPLHVETIASMISDAQISDEDGNIVLYVKTIRNEHDDVTDATIAEENQLANLFAAAPDLLESLENLMTVVNVRIDDPRIKQFDAARAAIAKAYGKAQE